MSRRPVGIFDSGLGGLSVAREVHDDLPAEDLLYLADTAYLPYGDRSAEWVRGRTLAAGRWLEEEGAKVLVVACNTASAAALETLREHLAIPVVGLEPAVKPAAAATRNGRVGVLATAGTVRSARLQRLVESYAQGREVVLQGCPGLADAIEDGVLSGPELRARLEPYLEPLRRAGVDTVVLGCTHYVFVRDAIAAGLGPDVRLLDSGEAVARQTARVLEEQGLRETAGAGSIRFLTTGSAAEVGPVVARLWGAPLAVEEVAIPADPSQRPKAPMP
ncbi:MAG TPA: glutamate racemase [Longimicrobiaceae bacterium]|nr:glutamate racemase [Longimicrobiaceae bacterium]